jgi:ankyrin repeat protein
MVKLLLDKGAKEGIALFHPIEKVNFQIIKYLRKKGANPKATDWYGNTLLHRQCERGNLKNVKYLIRHYNADGNAKNFKGQTPLHLACTGWNNNLKVVKFLIEEQNADPAVTCNEGKTALHYATAERSDLNILRYLIEDQKQDIEATDNEGRTALHMACQIEFLFKYGWETQKYLINDHAKIIEAKDKKGKTALYYCLEHLKQLENFAEKEKFNFRPIALILATNANILKKQENKDTDHICDWIKQSYDNDMKKSKKEDEALSCVIAGLKSFQKELDKKDNTNIEYNPLLYIVDFCNRLDVAEYMFNQDLCYIEKHFNDEDANSKRNLLLKSYLQFSCKKGWLDQTRFWFQEVGNRQESFQHLNFDGSFLRSACVKKHIVIFKYLLEDEKAKEEAAEFLNDFPLHYACKRGSLEMVQYIIETKKIDIEVKDKEGRTPLHFACIESSIEITKYLIENQNADINTTDNKGRSVLHSACQSRCFELVKYISQKTELDVNDQDEDGSTALHLACQWRNLKVVKFLITDMKANLHLIDKQGRTPLHVHCQSSGAKVQIAKFLVNKGANVLAKDKSGKTPLQITKTYKTEMIGFLTAATKR